MVLPGEAPLPDMGKEGVGLSPPLCQAPATGTSSRRVDTNLKVGQRQKHRGDAQVRPVRQEGLELLARAREA